MKNCRSSHYSIFVNISMVSFLYSGRLSEYVRFLAHATQFCTSRLCFFYLSSGRSEIDKSVDAIWDIRILHFKSCKEEFLCLPNAVSISLLLEYIIRVLSLNFYYKWYYFSDLLEFNCDISHTDIYATVTFFYCFIKVPQYIKTCTLLDTTSQDLNAKNVNLLYFFQL